MTMAPHHLRDVADIVKGIKSCSEISLVRVWPWGLLNTCCCSVLAYISHVCCTSCQIPALARHEGEQIDVMARNSGHSTPPVSAYSQPRKACLTEVRNNSSLLARSTYTYKTGILPSASRHVIGCHNELQ